MLLTEENSKFGLIVFFLSDNCWKIIKYGYIETSYSIHSLINIFICQIRKLTCKTYDPSNVTQRMMSNGIFILSLLPLGPMSDLEIL